MNIKELIKYLRKMEAKGATIAEFGTMNFLDEDGKEIGCIR